MCECVWECVFVCVYACAGMVRDMSVFEFVEVMQLAAITPHHVHEKDVSAIPLKCVCVFHECVRDSCVFPCRSGTVLCRPSC